ncbi:MAG TPA: 2-dehydropantoate 2-reductase [Bacteroidia bacterium]|nr:2-dehydropantoate 2-reductase [Bacteroidia bacterium]
MKKRIAVLGIGGVGGFYGGKLAQHYSGDPQAEIIFIAHGTHAEAISAHGLKISEGEKEIVVHPDAVTDELSSAGIFDVLLVCVKTYSLEGAIASVRKNVNEKTAVIPLMNGIEPYELLLKEFPQAKIFRGCCYFNAYIEAPGAIRFRGGFNQVLIGFEDDVLLSSVAGIFQRAGINTFSRKDISKEVWEKFIFASAIASVGSLENDSFGQVLEKPEKKRLLTEMLEEVISIARAKNVFFGPGFIPGLLEKMSGYPYEARTSMQLDFSLGRKTELETFTGYVVRTGRKAGVPVPSYESVYAALKQRA